MLVGAQNIFDDGQRGKIRVHSPMAFHAAVAGDGLECEGAGPPIDNRRQPSNIEIGPRFIGRIIREVAWCNEP